MFGTLIDAPTSASSNAECSTSTTSQPSESRKNVCLLVNDDGDRVFRGLTECSKVGLEDGALAPVESDADGRWRAFDLHIDNKYYSADVTVVSAATCEGIDAWRKKNPKCAVPALIVRVQTNSTSVLTLLADVEQRLNNLLPEAKAIVVCGPQSSACGFVPSESENLYESELNVFCDRQHFEFIDLEPNEDMQNTLVNEYRENIGIARVWELLETSEWTERRMKPNPHRGNPRPKNDLDYREDDWPNSEDEEAIVEAFMRPCHDFSSSDIPPRISPLIQHLLMQQIREEMGYIDNGMTEMLQGLALRNRQELNQAAKAPDDIKDEAVAAEDTTTQEAKKSKKKKKKSKKKPAAAVGEAEDAPESEASTLKDPDEHCQNKDRAEQTEAGPRTDLPGQEPGHGDMPLFSWMADETFEEMLGTVEGMKLVELLGRVNQTRDYCAVMDPRERIDVAGNMSLELLQALVMLDEEDAEYESSDDSDADTIKPD